MVMVTSIGAPQKCDAHATGRAVTDWGEEALPCQVRTGLRSFMDRQGIRRYFCASQGHRENAQRRFGVAMFEGMD